MQSRSRDIDEVLEKLATAGISGNEVRRAGHRRCFIFGGQAEDDDCGSGRDGTWTFRQGSWTRLLIRSAFTCARWALCRCSSESRKYRLPSESSGDRSARKKGITRSPMAVAELLKVGAELEEGTIGIRDVVSLLGSDGNRRARGQDRRVSGLDHRRHRQHSQTLQARPQGAWLNSTPSRSSRRGKASKKLTRLRRKVARTRLESRA